MSPSATNLRAQDARQNTLQAVQPAIRIGNLQKKFGDLLAIDWVSVDIGQGEFFMIVGPSGCGKTTLGLGEGSKIFMVAIGVFFPVVINATTGVLEINRIYLDVGRNFKASRWNTFWTIALPGALPVIMTGFKLGVGIGLVLIAIAEMIGAKSRLGYMMWSAWETFSVERMHVGLFMIALIGFALTLALNELERVIIPLKRD